MMCCFRFQKAIWTGTKQSLHISPIDAYSTMKVMGLDKEAKEVQHYVVDSIDFDKDLFVKTFEVNIRILGGLLAMYEFSEDKKVLAKAEDFGKRLLPAFSSPTGIPYYWVNLRTGEAKGEEVNMAEGGSMPAGNGHAQPVYRKSRSIMKQPKKRTWRYSTGSLHRAGRRKHQCGNRANGPTESAISVAASTAITNTFIKGWLLFGDEELKNTWDKSIQSIQTYIADEVDSSLWYGTR